MTKALFLVDSYLKESPATVVSVKDGKYVSLDQTEVNHMQGNMRLPSDSEFQHRKHHTYTVRQLRLHSLLQARIASSSSTLGKPFFSSHKSRRTISLA